MTYSEKLKDPRWQKKRLEILERDRWKCLACGSGNETLHVHHVTYIRGYDPWDTDDESLVTLCCGCHNTFHKMIKKEPTHWIIKQSKLTGYDVTLFFIYIMRTINTFDNNNLKEIVFRKENTTPSIKEVLMGNSK